MSVFSGLIAEAKEILDERKQASNIEKRCVADVTANKGKDLSGAFAICRSSMQKSGNYKEGSMDLTKKGAAKSRASGHKKDNKSKVTHFEKEVESARKTDK